jgi:hypothetical protein
METRLLEAEYFQTNQAAQVLEKWAFSPAGGLFVPVGLHISSIDPISLIMEVDKCGNSVTIHTLLCFVQQSKRRRTNRLAGIQRNVQGTRSTTASREG